MNKIKFTMLYKMVSIIAIILIMGFVNGCSKDDDYGTNGGNRNNNPDPNSIILQGNTFSPSSLTVSAGTTITWTNNDSHNHTVTSGTSGSPDGKFDSGNIGSNGTFSYKFDTPGTYNYYCKLHSGMTGKIIVQ